MNTLLNNKMNSQEEEQVTLVCSSQKSEQCKKRYKFTNSMLEINPETYSCYHCTDNLKNFFKNIDSANKAYILGYCLPSFSPGCKEITLKTETKNRYFLETLRELLSPNLFIESKGQATLTIDNKPFIEELQRVIGDDYHVSSVPTEFFDHVLRGVFDSNGYIETRSRGCNNGLPPWCSIANLTNKKLLDFLIKSIRVPLDQKEGILVFSGLNCLDFLGKLYKNTGNLLRIDEKYKAYCSWLIPQDLSKLPVCKIYKTDPEAVFPDKPNQTDVGYDLTVIRKVKDLTSNVALYDTGIKVTPPYGYYTEIVGRSSLSKTGYMLANNIGIIDPTYSGNLFIALAKINNDSKELQLPFRCCQLIVRKQNHVLLQEEIAPIEKTSRNSGGYGSSG